MAYVPNKEKPTRLDKLDARLDPFISHYHRKLRSSEEVMSLQISYNKWYEQDRGSTSQVMIKRLVALWSCICLLFLYSLRLPVGIRNALWDDFVEARDDIRSFWAWASGSLVKSRKARPKPAPGYRLLKIADFFFSPKTVTLTFSPLIADWHLEYFEALKEHRYWKARWISVRYYWSFAKAFGLSKILDVLKGLTRIMVR